jgi:uncharacterized protein (TIGR02217 family)
MPVTVLQTHRLPENIEQGARCYPSRWNNTRTMGMNGKLDVNINWDDPVGRYDISFALQSFGSGAVQRVIALHMNTRGGYGFLFKDPADHRAPFLFDREREPIGGGDGTTTTFQAIVRYGDEAGDYVRTARRLDPETLRVWVNGVETQDFTLDGETGLITLATAPEASQSVEAAFEFFKAVVFERDELPAEIRLLLRDNRGGSVGAIPAINLMEVVE